MAFSVPSAVCWGSSLLHIIASVFQSFVVPVFKSNMAVVENIKMWKSYKEKKNTTKLIYHSKIIRLPIFLTFDLEIITEIIVIQL